MNASLTNDGLFILHTFCVFSQGSYSVTVSEDSLVGTILLAVTAFDNDIDDVVTYTLVSPSSTFLLDQRSGRIIVAKHLDRELQDSYSLYVQASDGQRSSTATVDITIGDINDNSPTFNPVAYRYF